MKRFSIIWLLTLAVLFVTACAPTGIGQAPATSTPGQVSVPDAVEAAQNMLAGQLNVGVGTIQVKVVEPVNWPDACLGLPGADEMCAEVITSGYRVTLEVNGSTYILHTNQDGSQIRAETREPPKGEIEPLAVQRAREYIVNSSAGEYRERKSVLLLEQGGEQVLDINLLVRIANG